MIDNNFKTQVNQIKKQCKDKGGAIGIYRITLENPDGTKEVKWYHNVITISAFAMIMNNLTDPTPTNAMVATHCLLGDDDTAVTENDTVLGNETYRNAIASMTSADNVGYFTAFFDQTETSGTYKEAGFVSDGAAGADTGILISHVNIDVTKTLVQKLTIDWTLTLVNA